MDLETKREFESIHGKFADMHEQFVLVNKRMDEGFAAVAKRFDFVDEEIEHILTASVNASDSIQKRLDGMENQMVTKTYFSDYMSNFARTNNLRLREEGPEYNQ